MPELRKDPVIGRWVIIATERARRPGNFIDTFDTTADVGEPKCWFCHNRRKLIVPESPQGIRVVASNGDIFGEKKRFHRVRKGLYEVIDGVGAHEIIIESKEHIANLVELDPALVEDVIKTYAARMKALGEDGRYQYVVAYKNYGPTAGGRRISHTRSHIVATPVMPIKVHEKLEGAQIYYQQHKRCIYCDLIAQEIKDKARVVCESDHYVAIIPFAARFLFEVWVFPKAHHCDFSDGVGGSESDLAELLKTLLRKFQKGLNDAAYNFVVQTAPYPLKSDAPDKWATLKQDYHWHLEITPRLTRLAGFEKGTGFYICAIPPEAMAEYLRGIH